MTAATLTLTEFLLARIAEDEAVAREASTEAADPSGHWEFARYDYEGIWCTEPGCAAKDNSADETWPECVHATRWDPARVLAECEAKRRIVEHHDDDDDVGRCTACAPTMWARASPWPCPTLRFLALPYVDHPDYDEVWRP